MAMTKTELIEWLNSLPADADIAVDDGGLTLVCLGGEEYLEVGGEPEQPAEPPPFHTRGPWTVCIADEPGCYIVEEAAKEQEDRQDDESSPWKMHDDNNALVIAAAPEMFLLTQGLAQVRLEEEHDGEPPPDNDWQDVMTGFVHAARQLLSEKGLPDV